MEYLVGRALGDPSDVRVEWDPYDVVADDGTVVEVKATGRLQSWATRRLSTPSWSFKSVRASRMWSEDLGEYVDVDPAARVHVWVFALHTATEPAEYDPLDVDQWEFRAVPHRELLASGQTSARLSFSDRLGIAAVPYERLRSAVAEARSRNHDLADGSA